MYTLCPTPRVSPFATVLCGKLRGDRIKSRAEEVLATLAWALRCEIPFPDALQVLSSKQINYSSINVTLIHNSSDWDACVNLANLDLRRGEKLSISLKRLHKFIPSHLIAAIAAAEDAGHLIEFIQIASKHLRFTNITQRKIKTALTYSTMQLIMITSMFSALYLFIFPKFTHIYAELYGGARLPPITQALFNVQSNINPILSSVQLLCIITIIIIVISKISPAVKKIGELLTLKIPWIGTVYRNISLMECSEMMAASLATGNDISKAADFTSKTTSRIWLKDRLTQFAVETAQGERWANAWERMRISRPYHNWILRNAAAMERPMEGFSSLGTVLKESVLHETTLLIKAVELAALLINAVLVGFIVLGLGTGIFSIIYLVAR